MGTQDDSRIKRRTLLVIVCLLHSIMGCQEARRVQRPSSEHNHLLPSLNPPSSESPTQSLDEEVETNSDPLRNPPSQQLGQCEPPWDRLLPRRLRPLSPNELKESWIDLLSSTDDFIHTDHSSRPCDEYQFTLHKHQVPHHILNVDTVHIASELNNWADTIEAGGWPLDFSESEESWWLYKSLPIGSHSYKIVINEDHWMTDPQNMNQEADGYGGYNSVAEVYCTEAELHRPTLTRQEARLIIEPLLEGLPAIPRPRQFPYQNHIQSMTWTQEHILTLLEGSEILLPHLERVLSSRIACLEGYEFNSTFDQNLSTLSESCWQSVLQELISLIWRIKPTQESIQRLIEMGRQHSLSIVLRILLLSPYALHRMELGIQIEPDLDLKRYLGVAVDQSLSSLYQLSDMEMASALSFAIWGTSPDTELMSRAVHGELSDSAILRQEIERLLDHPKAVRHWSRFGIEWLGLEDTLYAPKRHDLFIGLNDTVRHSMVAEGGLLVAQSILSKSALDHSPLDLLYGNPAQTYETRWLNTDLLNYYGLEGVSLDQRTWEYDAYHAYNIEVVASGPHAARGGILGLGSTLMTYAHSDQSSPILRGLFVRERLLCQHFGPPPPNAGGVPDVDPNATTRERFRQHSDDPGCRGCHILIDELGFGFEGFDAAGLHREYESGLIVDSSGTLRGRNQLNGSDEEHFNGLGELGKLLSSSEGAQDCVVTQIRRYIYGVMSVHLGHELTSPDDALETCHLFGLRERFLNDELTLRQLILEILLDPSFRYRRSYEDEQSREDP